MGGLKSNYLRCRKGRKRNKSESNIDSDDLIVITFYEFQDGHSYNYD